MHHPERGMSDPITVESAMVLNPAVTVRDTGSGAVLLDVTSGSCWELNLVGAAVWSCLAAGQTLRQALDQIATRYGVNRSRVEADVLLLLSDLVKHGLIEVRS